MRRLISITLFVIGSFCVGMQVMIAFIRAPGNSEALVPPLVAFTGFAALFLAPATWLSIGHRWRELGFAVVIGATVITASTASLIFVPDETGFRPDIGPLEPYLDPGQGFANLGVLMLSGLALIWFGGEGTPLATRDELRAEGRALVRVLRDGPIEFGRAIGALCRKLTGRS